MKKRILTDHKKIGKILKPPLTTLNINSDLSWIDSLIPEVIWISLLLDCYGLSVGTEISIEIVKTVTKYEQSDFRILAFLSAYETLPDNTKRSIKDEIKKAGLLEQIQHCYKSFAWFYPMFPLSFLLNKKTLKKDLDVDYLEHFKAVLTELVDKRSQLSTFTIATVVYSQATLGRIVITKDSPLLKFPEIQDYPQTEISRIMASSARALINGVYGMYMEDKNTSWPTNFWNRGIELEKCII